MLILYVALKYDYGNPELGHSFEHYNFFDSLVRMGHDVLYFDLGKLQGARNAQRLNRRLFEIVRSERPDVMFTVPFRAELDRRILKQIIRKTSTPTIAWFCDDHWRFDHYTRHWAPCFTWSVTTAPSALPKYKAIGYGNVIRSQWACNHFRYRRLDLPPKCDVTFVGQPHGNRRRWIERLREAGIQVQAWGSGWESGRLDHSEMLDVFARSRINLNLSNASTTGTENPDALKHRVRRTVARFLPRPVKTTLKGWLAQPSNVKLSDPLEAEHLPDQIKGRTFEVPGCGGFMLTGLAEDLESYYANGREVVCFQTIEQLIEQIRYYLSHEEERVAIAEAGYRRTLKEHTYVHRFTEIFRRLQLSVPSSDEILARELMGQVQEVTGS
jgi:spore maturation protein CgeB